MGIRKSKLGAPPPAEPSKGPKARRGFTLGGRSALEVFYQRKPLRQTILGRIAYDYSRRIRG